MVALREEKLTNGTISLYLDIYFEKRRVRKRLNIYLDGGKNDKEKIEIAENERRKAELEILRGIYVPNSTMNTSFYSFYEQHKSHFLRVNEKDNLIRHMKNYKKEVTFKQIDDGFWAGLKDYFVSINHQPYTIYTAQKNLLTILNFAVKKEMILHHNITRREKRPASTRTYLTFEEVKTLLSTECANELVKSAFLFACFTGLRIGDIRKLRYSDIINGQIEITQEKTERPLFVPLNESAKQFIPKNNSGDTHKLIFNKLPRSSVHAVMREWVARSGIKKHVVFHTSRHTFATLAINAKVPVAVLKDLLGHSEIETTMIYAKIMDSSRVDAVNALPSLTNLEEK